MRPALFALVALVATASTPHVSRSELKNVERQLYESIVRFNAADPMDMLGPPRGMYLEKYGVVFSTEIGLVAVPGLTPFHQKVTREEVERLRQRKLARLPQIRQLMRDLLLNAGVTLKNVPLEEQVVLGVTLFSHSYEDTTGMPGQIVFQAQRKALVDYEAGRIRREALNAAIQETAF